MENFKFVLFSIFILVLLGFSGYWAFSTIESGSTHVDNQKLKELEEKNIDLEKQVADLTREISLSQEDKKDQVQKDEEDLKPKVAESAIPTPSTTPIKTAPVTKTTSLKYQSLINDLQKLVDNNVFLKLKSQGTAVGTLQKSLNIYNNTSNKIDNDYGTSTVTVVKNFQKAQGLTADGEAGPTTFKKMISWLKTK